MLKYQYAEDDDPSEATVRDQNWPRCPVCGARIGKDLHATGCTFIGDVRLAQSEQHAEGLNPRELVMGMIVLLLIVGLSLAAGYLMGMLT